MIEIIILVLAGLFMARKPKARRRFTLRRVRVSPSLALVTLAANTALTAGMSGNADGAYRCVSIKATWGMHGVNNQTGGPFTVGYAHSDYTVAEIKECIEAASAINLGDKIAQEKANRLVRIVGVLDAADATQGDDLNDGKPISTKLNWMILIGKQVNLFAYNDGTVAVTGASLKVTGDMWIRDSA